MRIIYTIIFAFLANGTFAQLLPNLGGQRAGVSTLSFLKTDISPRSMSLGGANVALTEDAFAWYHNPALAADLKTTNFALSSLVFGEGMYQGLLSGTYAMPNSTSAFGLTLNNLNSGAMEVRTEFQPQGTGEFFYVNYLAAGLSYSKRLSDKFSFGLTLKYINEQIWRYTNHTAAFDMGFLYRTDVRDLQFAVMIQNFGGNSSLAGEDLLVSFNRDSVESLDQFTVPTLFKLGASIIAYENENLELRGMVQLNHPNDNAENLRFGLELKMRELFFIRTGWKLNVAGQPYPTFGIGLKRRSFRLDYGVNPTLYQGLQHLIGFQFQLAKTVDR